MALGMDHDSRLSHSAPVVHSAAILGDRSVSSMPARAQKRSRLASSPAFRLLLLAVFGFGSVAPAQPCSAGAVEAGSFGPPVQTYVRVLTGNVDDAIYNMTMGGR